MPVLFPYIFFKFHALTSTVLHCPTLSLNCPCTIMHCLVMSLHWPYTVPAWSPHSLCSVLHCLCIVSALSCTFLHCPHTVPGLSLHFPPTVLHCTLQSLHCQCIVVHCPFTVHTLSCMTSKSPHWPTLSCSVPALSYTISTQSSPCPALSQP